MDLTAASLASAGDEWTVSGEGGDTLVGVEKVTDSNGEDFLLVGEGGYATI